MEITIDLIKNAYKNWMAQLTVYEENDAYVKGKNPEIMNASRKKDPDNRLPVPLAKMAVIDMAGYAGRPGDVTIDLVSENDDSDYFDIVAKWLKENQDDLELSELYKMCLSQGCDYELFWVEQGEDTPLKPRWKRQGKNQIYVKYNTDIIPKKEAAFRFWKEGVDKYCEVYLPYRSELWEMKEGQADWRKADRKDNLYPYSEVPVIEYAINMEKEPIFEAQKKLVEAYDKLLSSSSNEVDRFNALLALFPGKTSKEFFDRLVELKVIDDLDSFDSDKWPKYLEKNLSGVTQFYNDLADRLERLFHKTIKIPDMADPQFSGSDASGVARAFKLLGMEFQAAMFEIYFCKGIKQRKQFFDDIIKASSLGIAVDDYDIEVDAKRNMPVDLEAKVRIAQMLKGLVSDETLLQFLPNEIVHDVEKELSRTEEQKEKNAAMFQGVVNGFEEEN